jgi:DnaJ-class molecular chaperone
MPEIECPDCGGYGWIAVIDRENGDPIQLQMPCYGCNETGLIYQTIEANSI